MGNKSKLTQQQKDLILERSSQGVPNTDIATELKVDIRSVNGYINTMRNLGRTASPASPSPSPKPPEDPGMSHPPAPSAAPASAPALHHAPPAPPQTSPDAGGEWKAPGAGQGESFVYPSQKVEYKIERVSPRDGVLTVQSEQPSDDEIGRVYGAGVYRIWKAEGSKVPVFREVQLAKTYGEPRFPEPPRVGGGPRMGERFARRDEENQDERGALRPPFRSFPPRPGYEGQPLPSQQQNSLGEFARHSSSAQENIVVTAFTKMGEMHEKTMERLERERQTANAPADTIKTFLMEQQALQNQRMEQERQREEQRRRDEREAAERREQERENQHKRDMERMKQEAEDRVKAEREARQTMLDLEKTRMDLMRQDAENRERALKAELERYRLEAKEEREKLLTQLKEVQADSKETIESVRDEVEEELEKGRQSLTREFDLKEQQLQAQAAHQKELLELQKQILQSQNGDETTKMIGKLVEGLERTVKEVVDLKKIEAATAESHLANAAKGPASATPGETTNIQTVEARPALPNPANKETSPATRPASGNGNGNGHGSAAAKEESMDNYVRQMAGDPFFQDVLKEWSRHIKAEDDATTFANMFMEWMRDDGTPESGRARRACSVFVNCMKVRDWTEMYGLLAPAIPAELQAIFKTQHATVFYDQFRLMVVESVKDYWRAYMEQKQAEEEARKKAAQERAGEGGVQRIPAAPAQSQG